MQSHPFCILSINNNNPRQPASPPCKQDNQRQLPQLLTSIPSQTLPIGLAEAEEKEEQENKEKENKVPRRQEKQSLYRTHTLLITLMRLMRHTSLSPWPQSQSICIFRHFVNPWDESESEGEESAPATALLYRNAAQLTPTILVAAVPFSSAACATTTQRIFPRAPPSSSRSGYHAPARRKRQWGI